jgi:hypothetical protein
MVLAQYGQLRTEEKLCQLLGTGPHGTRTRDLLRLTALGFEVRIGRSNLAEVAAALAAGVPPIVFLETTGLEYWNQRCDHVAVLVGLGATAVLLNDP